ncbi:MAG: hypothetical protein JSV86_18535 [Gemmatimonadota bacterium]|nr:MAG: hypothetical protein JSV86_18535 [Gemmatimonadota bacterium]
MGTHKPGWLRQTFNPLFLSRVTLAERKQLPEALGRWALDSGAFSELAAHGRWTMSAEAYADEAERYAREIGKLDWAAPQDWMCEPSMLEKTGKTVAEHQALTVRNFLELRSRARAVHFIPVLQGWSLPEYLQHARDYQAAGVNLYAEPIVGVGSVCRRQHTGEIANIFEGLIAEGFRNLHGFGVKLTGLRSFSRCLKSADSLAWSYTARRHGRMLRKCRHQTCANCLDWALTWRKQVIRDFGS